MANEKSNAWLVTIIVGCLIVGATAGWLGRGVWNAHNLNRAILAAYAKVEAPAKIDIWEL